MILEGDWIVTPGHGGFMYSKWHTICVLWSDKPCELRDVRRAYFKDLGKMGKLVYKYDDPHAGISIYEFEFLPREDEDE